MKILKSNLLPALESACRISGNRTALPILSSVLLSASGGRLSVRASNIEQESVETVECDGDFSPVCIPSKRIADAIKFSGESIELTVDDKNRLRCDSGSKFEIAGVDAEEFPKAPEVKFTAIGVNAQDLAAAVKAVAWCASTDISRTELHSVYISGDAKILTAIATNGKALSRYSKPAISAEFQILLPDSFAPGLVAALLRKGAQLFLSENKVLVRHDFGEFSAKLMEGQFPVAACGSVIKGVTNKIGEIKADELLARVKASLSLYADDAPSVSLDFDAKKVAVSSSSSDCEYASQIDGKFRPISFLFDHKLLSAALSQFGDEQVELIGAEDGLSPFLIRHGNVECVVMGMRSK